VQPEARKKAAQKKADKYRSFSKLSQNDENHQKKRKPKK
jgi:hypothetical protein